MSRHSTIASPLAGLMTHRRHTVPFVLRGQFDKGRCLELRQPHGRHVNLSAIFGERVLQKANDGLVAASWM